MTRKRGYSLLEAILASFLLIATFLMVGRLFQTGLQYSSKVEKRLMAVQFAESRMAELKRLARGNDDWTDLENLTLPNPPGFTVEHKLRSYKMFTPSTMLEEPLDTTDKGSRTIRVRSRRAVVTVSWPPGGKFQLTGLVTRRTEDWLGYGSVQIRGNVLERVADNRKEIKVFPETPPAVTGTGPIKFTAQGYDNDGNPVTDLTYHWTVEPAYSQGNPATGRIENITRDGTSVNFYNQVRRANGDWETQDGFCRVRVQARLNGIIGVGRTEVFEVKQ